MRISISYPPINTGKGVPLLSQNRQFQWFSEPTYIYPMVPAYAATLLKNAGYEVIWDDGIAEEKSYSQWLGDLVRDGPDVVMIETKTPVVKRHWKIIEDVKEVCPKTKVVLAGDHVTALPQESMENSKVDYVLTGGDYDFLLLNLVEHLDGKGKLEPGILYRVNGKIKSTGSFQLDHDLDGLPFVDRDLTKWWLYSEKNGNYKVTPGTYVMAGRDCWWRRNGGCTFCSWTTVYPTWRVRRPELLVDEVGMLIERYGVREIFDDTGTFPVRRWLRRFCDLMIERGYNEEVLFSCNMRFGALSLEDYRLMRKAGFRMLLFGLESASQQTLDRLNKGVTVEDIVKGCKMAREEGLEPHITIMVGYPWESREDALGTLKLARMLMKKGWAVTLQSTIVMPYPGTKMYDEAVENGWFRTDPKDYDCFDMRESVLNTVDMEPEEVMRVCDEIYKVFLSPKYMFRHLIRIRSWGDVKYSIRGAMKVLGHVKDFARNKSYS
jgi:anaerobic magnesium-protoporphyrin IX monomethyl ester cyclase